MMPRKRKRVWTDEVPWCSFCNTPIPNGTPFVSLSADVVVVPPKSRGDEWTISASHSLAYYCLTCQPFLFVAEDVCEQIPTRKRR